MKSLISSLLIALSLSLSLSLPALAQGPEPTPDLPYHFEPLEIGDAPHDIPINFTTPDFINKVGSYALTVFTLLDKYQVLGIFVVIMLGLSALWWLYSFVTDRPVLPLLNISGAIDAYDGFDDYETDRSYNAADAAFGAEYSYLLSELSYEDLTSDNFMNAFRENFNSHRKTVLDEIRNDRSSRHQRNNKRKSLIRSGRNIPRF
jgi:hypothetical protein